MFSSPERIDLISYKCLISMSAKMTLHTNKIGGRVAPPTLANKQNLQSQKRNLQNLTKHSNFWETKILHTLHSRK